VIYVLFEKKSDGIHLNKTNNHQIKKLNGNDYQESPHPYKYWTLKEIHEQAESSRRVLKYGWKNTKWS